jgi:hypothetical protein
MLFDTSIKDKETKQTIEQLVGKPFGILDILKIGAVGSSRMEIVAYSKLFSKVMQWDKQAVFASIAMRPKGLLVIINVRLNNYSWVIPYHYLSIFKTDILVIHGQGEYLKMKVYGDQNKKLIEKILEFKNKQLNPV